MPQEGLLLQLDTSEHRWGRVWRESFSKRRDWFVLFI